MKTKRDHDPIDILADAYEKMFERAAEHFRNAEEKTGELLHSLIDEARETAVELKEISREDAEKLAAWLKRDLDEATGYLSETGHDLRDWLGFETTLVESGIVDLLLKAADKTTLQLLRIKEEARRASTYHTGEITAPGTLVCEQCGEKLHFHKTGRIPPCPKCHATNFKRNVRA